MFRVGESKHKGRTFQGLGMSRVRVGMEKNRFRETTGWK
jgi:hypothetical protein